MGCNLTFLSEFIFAAINYRRSEWNVFRSCWKPTPFKGTGHYWHLLKIIVGIKLYLVTSNGELLIVYNIMRNGSIWSNIVFDKEVISHSHNKTLQLKPFIMHLKAHKVCNKGVFSLIILLSPNFYWFLIVCMLGYTIEQGPCIHQVRILIFDNIAKRVQCL